MYREMMAGSYKLLKINVLIVCAVLFIAVKCVATHRLNVPRVLLPIFNDFPVNFTLEVTEGGCYKWSTSRLDLIKLIPLNENTGQTCSSAVMVQTVTKESTRNTAIVLAEDISTGQLLRCDVIVDAIFSFNLVTTTRELFIEEAPEAFEVRAYDEQGNEFTTLAGVEFTWTIGSGDKRGSHADNKKPLNNVLRFMTFQESPYETPVTVSKLDSAGRRGHIALLEGIRTGSAKVSVRLSYAEYEHVPAIEAELIVVANLIILPSDVTMMAYDTINYRIMQVQQGRLVEISLPSAQYYLESQNTNVLQIINDHGCAYALCQGKAKVVLHDRNVDEDYGVVLPSAIVNVNELSYISLTVLPDRNWGLILGETHEIALEIYDNKDHKFYIGEGVEAIIRVDEKYFDIRTASQNGTNVVVVPIATGTTLVEATLLAIINKEGKRINLTPQLSARAELTIHSPVVSHPPVLAVPFDPQSKSRVQAALRATGGDGVYVWTSEQPAVASVSQNGIVKSLQLGSANVVVAMARNQYNRAVTKVHILVPSRLEIIQYSMEAAIGESTYLHVAMYGEMMDGIEVKEMPFNDCSDIPLNLYISDTNFVQNYSDKIQPLGIACTTISLVASQVGLSTVTVAYNNNGQYLTDNVTISVYEPLIAMHPTNGETLLAVGSSRKIIFQGGPRPWFGRPQGYNRELIISHSEIVCGEEQAYTKSGSSDIYVFEIMCKALGDALLTLKVSNAPVLPNCRHTEASASVKVSCGKPRYISLQPVFKDSENCPIAQNTDRILAHSNKDLELTVLIKDEDGRYFDNATSLNVEWSLEPTRYGNIEKLFGLLEETSEEMSVVLPKRHYRRILPTQKTGSLQVQVCVTGYQLKLLSEIGITAEYPPFPTENEHGVLTTPEIRAAMDVTLANDTVITPNRIKILNDPHTKYSLQVSQGSGFYEFVLSTEDIADVQYIEPTKTISIIPKKSGILRIALVDLCLESNPAEAIIEVQQLGGIDVDMVNKIEKGKCVTAALRLYDTNDHPMQLPSIKTLDIRAETENGYVEVKQISNDEHKDPLFDEIHFMVYGLEEGESRLRFTSGSDDQEIRSEPITVQVFLPLKIIPRNATILISTAYQISTIGGPTNSEIEYICENEDKIGVNSEGILDGRSLGQATIFARAIGLSSKGKRIVYSQDSIKVNVILLEGIKIVAPIVRLKVGATIPLWAFGIPDQLTPLIIGSMKTPLKFSWSTSNSDILKLHSMYDGTGIDIEHEHDIALRATALQAGSAVVYLNVTIPCTILTNCKSDVTFTSFLKLETFDELELLDHGNGLRSSVISMAPNSVLKLETNRDRYGQTSYSIIAQGSSEESDTSNALTQMSSTVRVDKNGFVTSGENFGKTVVLVTNIEAHTLKQSLTIIIDVKPVYYMMLEFASNLYIRPGEQLNILPRGMTLEYIVRYYDNVGTRFHAAETSLSFSTSRSDLATLAIDSGNKLSSKFNKNGKIVAKIFDEKYPNGMFDYVNMTVGDILFPSKTTLTVGDVVCFSMPLLSSDGESGYWQTSDPDILTVDAMTGIARALNGGHVFVKHNLATGLQRDIELTIQPIAEILLVPSHGKNITGTEIFSVPLVLKSVNQERKENNILSRDSGGCRLHYDDPVVKRYPYSCSINFPSQSSSIDVKDFFDVKPRFDIVTGFYYCDVIPIGPPTKVSSTIDTSIQICARSRDVEAIPLIVSHLPAVYVSHKEVTFIPGSTGSTSSATVDVHGIPTVLAQLSIQLPEGLTTSDLQMISRNTARFKIRLTHNQNDIHGKKIYVISELTQQNIPILVQVSKYDALISMSGIHWLDYVYYHRYTFGTFAALLVTFFYVYRHKTMSIDVLVRNKSIFADKCPPPIKKTASPSSPNTANTTTPPSARNSSPTRPFSAFEPVYGDPRGFYTPNARRNRSQISSLS